MYFLNKGTPWVLQVLPSLLPFFWKERIFLSGSTLFKHLHWLSLFHVDEAALYMSLPRHAHVLSYLLPAYQTSCLLVSTSQLTSCSVWKCLEVGEETLLWLEQTISSQPFPLGEHGNPTMHAQWNEVGVIQMAPESVGDEDLSRASVSVLDWALQGWRHSAFSPR